MRKITIIAMGLLFLGMIATGSLWSQEIKFPRVSQGASVSQTIGLTEVTIKYHRPGVKDRVIWGDLVPYDQVWRTGANEATTITFGSDVMVEGSKLPAGAYGLFTIPGKTEWTFIFSKQAAIWGDMGYKEEEDVLRVKAAPAEAPHCEWMHFMFADLTEDSARVILHWEKLMVGFTIKVDTKGILLGNIEKTMGRYWVSPYYAANFAFEGEMYEKAKQWIDMSVSLNKSYWNLLLQAKIYKKLAKTKADEKQALMILEKAVMAIKDLREDQKPRATEGPKLLEEWKGKNK